MALADLHDLVGDYDEAFRLYSEVARTLRDLRAWHGMAAALRKRGDYDEALAVDRRSVRRRGACELRPDAALARAGLAPLGDPGRFDEAIEVLEAALAVDGVAKTSVVGQLLNRLARAEVLAGTTRVALAACASSRRRSSSGRRLPLAWQRPYRLLGDIYTTLGSRSTMRPRRSDRASSSPSGREHRGDRRLPRQPRASSSAPRVPRGRQSCATNGLSSSSIGSATGPGAPSRYSNLAWMLANKRRLRRGGALLRAGDRALAVHRPPPRGGRDDRHDGVHQPAARISRRCGDTCRRGGGSVPRARLATQGGAVARACGLGLGVRGKGGSGP